MYIESNLSYQIRGAIFEVYNELGPGLLESVYQKALIFELKSRKLRVESEVFLPVYYKGVKLEMNFRIDLLIEDKIVIEIKSVENLSSVHHKQLLNYLKLARKELGILVNFNTDTLTNQIFRKVNTMSK
jgi:GxxExxY protein